MSNKNNRVKHLEKIMKVEVEELHEDIRLLNEENSVLRLLIEQMYGDIKPIRREQIIQGQYQLYLNCRLDDEENIRRFKDNELRKKFADIEVSIDRASRSFLGRFFLK